MELKYLGKPVAVTHSRGKGQQGPTPGSDPQYERQQWEVRKQNGGKRGRSKVIETKLPEDYEDFVDDENEENLNGSKPNTSTFHSMAEIASCSYEARQVMF